MNIVRLIAPFVVALVIVTGIALLVLLGPERVMANMPFLQRAQLAAATSTVTYMTPGTATTTLYIDSQNTGFDNAGLLIQYTASGTASTLKWRYEFAQSSTIECDDSPSACDWYSESVQNNASTATTTIEVRDNKEYSWLFASSTPGGQTAPQDRAMKYLVVPTPTRFARVVFYMGIGGQNGAIWAELVGRKQQSN